MLVVAGVIGQGADYDFQTGGFLTLTSIPATAEAGHSNTKMAPVSRTRTR